MDAPRGAGSKRANLSAARARRASSSACPRRDASPPATAPSASCSRSGTRLQFVGRFTLAALWKVRRLRRLLHSRSASRTGATGAAAVVATPVLRAAAAASEAPVPERLRDQAARASGGFVESMTAAPRRDGRLLVRRGASRRGSVPALGPSPAPAAAAARHEFDGTSWPPDPSQLGVFMGRAPPPYWFWRPRRSGRLPRTRAGRRRRARAAAAPARLARRAVQVAAGEGLARRRADRHRFACSLLRCSLAGLAGARRSLRHPRPSAVLAGGNAQRSDSAPRPGRAAMRPAPSSLPPDRD